MDTYFQYKMWTDFYIPAIFGLVSIGIFLFVGFCKFIVYLMNKRKETKKKKEGEGEE